MPALSHGRLAVAVAAALARGRLVIVAAVSQGGLVAAALAALALAGCLPDEPAVSRHGRIALRLTRGGPLVVTEPYVAGAARARYHLVASEGRSPTFSPDGNRLAYIGPAPRGEGPAGPERKAGEETAIFVAGLVPEGASRPILVERGILRARWSPTGRAIAFLHERPGENAPPGLSAIDLGSGASRLLTPSLNWFFEWSLDGRSLATLTPVFEGAREKDTFANVAVIDVASGAVDVRANLLTDHFTRLHFSIDGSSVHFAAPRASFPAPGKAPAPEAVPAIRWSASARDARRLVEEGALPTGTAAAWPNEDRSAVLEASRNQVVLRTASGWARAADANAEVAIPAWISPREALYWSDGGWRVLDTAGLSRPFVLEPAGAWAGGATGTALARTFLDAAVRLEAKRAIVSSSEGIADDVTVTVLANGCTPSVMTAAHAEWFTDGFTLSLRARDGRTSLPLTVRSCGGETCDPPQASPFPYSIPFATATLEAGRGKGMLRLDCPEEPQSATLSGAMIQAEFRLGSLER